MVEEREKLQAEAVEEIENEIKAAQAIQEEQMNFMDKLRARWNEIAYQSTVGSRSVKILQTLIVFISLNVSLQYGVSDEGSLLNEIIALLPEAISGSSMTVIAGAILLSLIWLWEPTLGTFL